MKLSRLSFLLALAGTALCDRLRGRRVAYNAVFTPSETSRGTTTMQADVPVSFFNALVCPGSDDRHFKLPTLASARAV